MAVKARPAWLVVPGQVAILHGRGVQIVGARWTGGQHNRRRRLVFRAPDGKLVYEDFRPGEWLEIVTTAAS